jgi:hypothetical protein
MSHREVYDQAEVYQIGRALILGLEAQLAEGSFDWEVFLGVLEREFEKCVGQNREIRDIMYAQGRCSFLAGCFLFAVKEWLEANTELDYFRFDYEFEEKLEARVERNAKLFSAGCQQDLYRLYMWHIVQSNEEPQWQNAGAEDWILQVKIGEQNIPSLRKWNQAMLDDVRDALKEHPEIQGYDPFFTAPRRLRGEGVWQMRFANESPE